jgi:hypothetical protein
MTQIGNTPAMGLKRKVWVIGLVGSLLLVGCANNYQELMNEGDEHLSQGRSDDAILSYEGAFQETEISSEILESSNSLADVYRSLGRISDKEKALRRGLNIAGYCAVWASGRGCHFPEKMKEWP